MNLNLTIFQKIFIELKVINIMKLEKIFQWILIILGMGFAIALILRFFGIF
jgi:hypothetical protein